MAGRHALARVENLSRSGRVALWSRKKFDPIGESSQFADHLAGAHLLRLCADGGQPFLVAHALVKNLPNQATEPVGDRIDGLGVAEPRQRHEWAILVASEQTVPVEKQLDRRTRSPVGLTD